MSRVERKKQLRRQKYKKWGRRSLKMVCVCLFVFGAYLTISRGFSLYVTSLQHEATTKEVETLLEAPDLTREQLNTEDGVVLGILEIPRIGLKTTVIQGASDAALDSGVGHLSETGLPGDSRQIFLAGHRNTDFSVLQDIHKGDEIILRMPYGTFLYYVRYETDFEDPRQVVPETQVDVVRLDALERDELVLMTCFPFTFGADTSERFLVYADPKDV